MLKLQNTYIGNIALLKKLIAYLYIPIFCIVFLFSYSVVLANTFTIKDDTNTKLLNTNTIAEHYFTLEDLYKKTYQRLSEQSDSKSINVRDRAYFSVAQSLGVEKSDIKNMLFAEIPDFDDKKKTNKKQQSLEVFQKICSNKGNTSQKFRQCQEDIKTRVENELKRQRFQEDMHTYALNNQAFINGTLQDTHGEYFDIIVDLNIIDLLLFGGKMNIPKTGSPFLKCNPFNGDTCYGFNTDDTNNKKNTTKDQNNSQLASAHSTETPPYTDTNNTNPTNTNTTYSESESGIKRTNGNEHSSTDPKIAVITGRSETTQTTTVTNTNGFCVDPDGIIFQKIKRHTIVGNTAQSDNKSVTYYDPYSIDNFTNPNTTSSHSANNENTANTTTSTSSYASIANVVYPNNFDDIQRGNFINPQIKYTGGVYPDLSKISHKRKCKDDEDSFLNGRVCIKKICNDVLCIKINLKKGLRDSNTPLQKVDCVECHIDRGNEALSPLVGTLGQNTPNQHPMESNFLSAFGNLGKTINKHIYLMPKRLPFLAYDQAHPNHDTPSNTPHKDPKKNPKTKADTPTKKETESESNDSLNKKYQYNRALYNALLINNCNEIGNNFTKHEGYSVHMAEYCRRIGSEKERIEQQLYTPKKKDTIQNSIRSDNFDKMLRPFLQQFTSDMLTVNNYLQIIDPGNIKAKAKQCK